MRPEASSDRGERARVQTLIDIYTFFKSPLSKFIPGKRRRRNIPCNMWRSNSLCTEFSSVSTDYCNCSGTTMRRWGYGRSVGKLVGNDSDVTIGMTYGVDRDNEVTVGR
jgi:hypothetical protein